MKSMKFEFEPNSNNFQYAYSITYTNTASTSIRAFINESLMAKQRQSANETASQMTVVSETTLTWYFSALVSTILLGNIMGAPLAPYICERFGRRSK